MFFPVDVVPIEVSRNDDETMESHTYAQVSEILNKAKVYVSQI